MVQIKTGSVQHLALTVSDLKRSQSFYTGLLGFQKLMDLSPTRVLLGNGNVFVALTNPPEPSLAIKDDVFNENRMGLDHLSFGVASIGDLENALQIFEAEHISHGEIKDLRPILPLYVLAFRDPDNIQLELTAPAE